ncbi:MAG: sigma-70 family RNA polymerase sigma factor [Clostridia bacterium]|nr:sigma-70 family RNA polymerase sigma factor [Clostridia bacterium]
MLILYLSVLDTQEEKDKLEQLYINYKKLIYSIAFEYMRNSFLAEDAVHNTFLKLTNYLDKIDAIYDHKTVNFIGIVTKSVCIDMLRKEKALEQIELRLDGMIDSCCEDLDIKDLLKKIDKLPEIYRNTVMLKYFYKLSNQQICDINGISIVTLRKRLSRAKKYLNEVEL